MRTKKDVLRYLALIIISIILLNFISDKLFFRLDFTSDHRYTLSKATRNILKTLPRPVTVKAFFSKDLPPEVGQVRRDLRDMLVEYASLSHGKVAYEFIDPAKDAAAEQEASQEGIQPFILDSREKDKTVQKKVYLGVVIKMGEKSEIIPLVQPGSALEYGISSSIKKLSNPVKPAIALLQGQREPALSDMQQAIQSLSVLYNVEPVTLSDTSNNLAKYNTLAIVAPKDTFKAYQLQQLDDFLKAGKGILLAVNRVEGDLQTATGKTLNTGLEKWLSGKGVKVDDNFVLDVNCAKVRAASSQYQGFYTLIDFYYMPIATVFANHPITTGLSSVLMQFASTVGSKGDSGVQFVPLVMTSKKSATRPSPVSFDFEHQWTEQDFPQSALTLGAAVTLKNPAGKPGRMVVFGDGDFPVNGSGDNAMQLGQDNVNLFVNSIDWLSDETGLIDLRNKGLVYRPLEQISDASKTLVKWLNFLLPIVIILLYGFYRMQRNNTIRMKRMEEGYV